MGLNNTQVNHKTSITLFVMTALPVALLLSLFRLPLFSIFHLSYYHRLGSLIFLILFSFWVLRDQKQIFKHIKNVKLLLAISLLQLFVVLLLAMDRVSSQVFIEYSAILSTLWITLLVLLLSKERLFFLKHQLWFVAIFVAMLGGLWTLAESLLIHTRYVYVEDVKNFLLPLELTQLYPHQDIENAKSGFRAIGFLANSHASATALAWASLYLYFFRKIRNAWFVDASIAMTVLAVLTTGSISVVLPLLIVFILSTVCFYLKNQKWNYLKLFLILFLFLFCSVLLFFLYTPLWSRLAYYWHNYDQLPSRPLPAWVGCQPHLLSNMLNPQCHNGEIHILSKIFRDGFLSILPYLVFLLLPLIQLGRWVFLTGLGQIYLFFILSSLHYVGLDKWGVNSLFAISMGLLLRRSSDDWSSD